MTSDDESRRLDELDRLLNDPDVPLQPGLIWHLLDEVSRHSPGSVVGRSEEGQGALGADGNRATHTA